MERTINAVTMEKNQPVVKNRTKKLVLTAMLGTLATVLMLLEFPIPFAPSFVRMDFSELPVMIGGLLMGPVYGAAIAVLKVLISFLLNGTTTMGVGELANLIGSLAYVLPASLFYFAGKTKKRGRTALLIGTACASAILTLANALVVIPLYVRLFGMTTAQIVQMGTVVNPLVTDLVTMMLFSILPFNLFKYGVTSVITWFTYKRISRAVKG